MSLMIFVWRFPCAQVFFICTSAYHLTGWKALAQFITHVMGLPCVCVQVSYFDLKAVETWCSVQNRSNRQAFKELCLKDEQFKDWISKLGDSKAACKMCIAIVQLSYKGVMLTFRISWTLTSVEFLNTQFFTMCILKIFFHMLDNLPKKGHMWMKYSTVI